MRIKDFLIVAILRNMLKDSEVIEALLELYEKRIKIHIRIDKKEQLLRSIEDQNK